MRLVERLCRHYAERPGKGYGRFEDDFPMPRLVRQHVIEQSSDFATLAQQMMQHLQTRAEREELATGGFVLIARMRDFGADCLWVALLTEAVGSAITERLEIVDRPHLDFASLRVAGRIDLTAWQQGAERYISFLKGRGEVAHYFKLFLGCNDIVIALGETQKLVQTITHFADAQKLETAARDELMQRAHGYLDELGENCAPMSLDQVARKVWPSAPERLHATRRSSSPAASFRTAARCARWCASGPARSNGNWSSTAAACGPGRCITANWSGQPGQEAPNLHHQCRDGVKAVVQPFQARGNGRPEAAVRRSDASTAGF